MLDLLSKDHQPTAQYIKRLREVLPERFPEMTFSFLPADIVSQILNFGAPSPVDIQIRGRDLNANFELANQLIKDIRKIDGVADTRIQQSRLAPAMNINIDRNQAAYAGITQRDISNSLVVNLAGSAQVSSTFWLNPANGVSYPIVMQVPQHKIDTLAELNNVPISAVNQSSTSSTLGGMATFNRSQTHAVYSEYNIEPMVQIFATAQGRDLGAVASDIRKVLAQYETIKPRGTTIALKGQVSTMENAYSGLITGLIGAIALVYFIIVINFQSWRDPFIIIMALPAAMAGIVWMLFTTGTTFSVPALTGAIMCMGVATANSVLVVSFAKERLAIVKNATQAALEAGFARLRPVLMTALAMMVGMLPMALGLGEGGEQNAPLGRAVIGGLLFATVATLFFVPVIFSVLHRNDNVAGSANATQEI